MNHKNQEPKTKTKMENKNKKVNKTQKVDTKDKGGKKGNKRVKVEEVKQKTPSSVLILYNPQMLQSVEYDVEKDLKNLDITRFSRVFVFTEEFLPGFCEFTHNWMETSTGKSPAPGTVITRADYKLKNFVISDGLMEYAMDKCFEDNEELVLFDAPINLGSDETDDNLRSLYNQWEKTYGKKVMFYDFWHRNYLPISKTFLQYSPVDDSLEVEFIDECDSKKKELFEIGQIFDGDNMSEDYFIYGNNLLSFVEWFYGDAFVDMEEPQANSITRLVGYGQVVDEKTEKRNSKNLQFRSIQDF